MAGPKTAQPQIAHDAPPVFSLWEHYKGNRYIVTGVSLEESSLETLVTYRALQPGAVPWTRPLASFRSEVSDEEGQRRPRFRRLDT